LLTLPQRRLLKDLLLGLALSVAAFAARFMLDPWRRASR
jgi:hypothetical protein